MDPCVQCPVAKPPLPTITQTAAMVGNTLFLIQNLPAQVGLLTICTVV